MPDELRFYFVTGHPHEWGPLVFSAIVMDDDGITPNVGVFPPVQRCTLCGHWRTVYADVVSPWRDGYAARWTTQVETFEEWRLCQAEPAIVHRFQVTALDMKTTTNHVPQEAPR